MTAKVKINEERSIIRGVLILIKQERRNKRSLLSQSVHLGDLRQVYDFESSKYRYIVAGTITRLLCCRSILHTSVLVHLSNMKISHLVPILLAGNSQVNSLSIRQATSKQATINIGKSTSKAAFQASGWIYGFPDNGVEADTSIPEHFIKDVKFIGSRAGGAQTPTRGWWEGYKSYVPRLDSTISNYRTTRKYGGTFILLVHDLWGADGSQIPLYPGDNGNWTETENFLRQVVKDLRAFNMLDGLVIDIWNEPDITAFWDRPWNQYLQYYVRAHKLLR